MLELFFALLFPSLSLTMHIPIFSVSSMFNYSFETARDSQHNRKAKKHETKKTYLEFDKATVVFIWSRVSCDQTNKSQIFPLILPLF